MVAFVVSLMTSFYLFTYKDTIAQEPLTHWWAVQSIDTMKYSRDVAREKLNDPTFNKEIDLQVKNIAATGATHVAIGTPYDDEFTPFLARWVKMARKYNLSVWFRGNFSGWEGWFNYPKISREEHLAKLEKFITQNPNLFENGDIFTTCTECENGGPGDPRFTRDIVGYRKFLVDEYKTASTSFNKIDKNVSSNYFSMNGDVANLIMDPETTKSLNGIVVIDHYVGTAEKLAGDIKKLAEKSGGKIILGEMGVPIPDIHGKLNDEEQAKWLSDALRLISIEPGLIGLNYWTATGSSTSLWNNDGSAKDAANVLRGFYKAPVLEGNVVNELGNIITNAKISYLDKVATSDLSGKFRMLNIPSVETLIAQADGYVKREINVDELENNAKIVLIKERENIFFKLAKKLKLLFETAQLEFRLR